MAHHRPPRPAKGTRHPGSGRKKGTPNRISVEVRTLVSELVNNAAYQHKLRSDFQRRKVHPTIESLIWSYHLGKPKQSVELSGGLAMDITGKIEEERRIFASLDLHDLEQLAAESQGLVDRALQLVKVRNAAAALTPAEARPAEILPEMPANGGESALPLSDTAESLANTAVSDKLRYGNPEAIDQLIPVTPRDSDG